MIIAPPPPLYGPVRVGTAVCPCKWRVRPGVGPGPIIPQPQKLTQHVRTGD